MWHMASPGHWWTGPPCSTPSTAWRTLAYVPPGELCLHVLCGRAWAETWQLCAETASNARGERCTCSRRLLCTSLLCRHASFPTSKKRKLIYCDLEPRGSWKSDDVLSRQFGSKWEMPTDPQQPSPPPHTQELLHLLYAPAAYHHLVVHRAHGSTGVFVTLPLT